MSGGPYFDDGADDAAALPGFISDPMGVLRRRWLPVSLLIIFGLAGSLFYVQTQTPEYEARATVLVASQRISETLIASTVETNQLEKVSAILGELFSPDPGGAHRRAWALSGGRGRRGTHPRGEGRDPAQSDRHRTRFDEPGEPGSADSATVFEVLFTYTDPIKAAAVTNDLAGRFTDIHLRD